MCFYSVSRRPGKCHFGHFSGWRTVCTISRRVSRHSILSRVFIVGTITMIPTSVLNPGLVSGFLHAPCVPVLEPSLHSAHLLSVYSCTRVFYIEPFGVTALSTPARRRKRAAKRPASPCSSKPPTPASTENPVEIEREERRKKKNRPTRLATHKIDHHEIHRGHRKQAQQHRHRLVLARQHR